MRLPFFRGKKHGNPSRRLWPGTGLALAIALLVAANAVIAGCGSSGVSGVPIYPGATKVTSSAAMQPPGGTSNTGTPPSGTQNGQSPQPPTGNSSSPPPSGSSTNGQPSSQPTGGNSGNQQPPNQGSGSGTTGQSPQIPAGNAAAGGQNPGQNAGTTYWTSDSMDKVVAWYKEQLSGKTDFKQQTMQAPGQPATGNQSSTTDQGTSNGTQTSTAAPVIMTFKSGDVTKGVMINQSNDSKGGTNFTISENQQGQSSTDKSSTVMKATFTHSGGSASKSGRTYKATKADTSAVLVTNSGSLTLSNCTISKSGNSSSLDQSSFLGLNAGVLANNGGKLKMTGGTITTTGAGANGAFAYGSGSSVALWA